MPGALQNHVPSPLVSEVPKGTELTSLSPPQSEQQQQQQPTSPITQSAGATVAASAGSSGLAPSRHARHSSLKIRTDSANHDASLPQHPKTADTRSHTSFGDFQQKQQHAPAPNASAAASCNGTPKPAVAGITPIVIKRNTSFSQRIHNLLHRDKSQKHSTSAAAAPSPAVSGAAAQPSRHNGVSGHETPTIAYRTPTLQTQSTGVSVSPSAPNSANNSPPSGASPHASATNMAKDFAAGASPAYRAQCSFEPVPEDKVFAVTDVNLRSVQRHGSQIRHSIDKGASAQQPEAQHSTPSTVDGITHAMRHTSVETAAAASREMSAHTVSREPSQNTLHQNQTTGTAAKESAAVSHHVAPATPEGKAHTVCRGAAEESELAGRTLPSKPTTADIAGNRERLAAGTTRDMHPTSTAGTPSSHVCPSTHQKKPRPVYSTHKATLNQFGRQTKVIGEGTGGTVRLLQGVDVGVRPPSLCSGSPSSQHGDEPNVYVPSQHRLFAVKEFRKKRQDETPRAYMKKVTSEFCIGSSIHHENVIETLDLIFEGNRVYEIMEFCPHDLFTFVAMGNMDLEETFCWFKQVCQGVKYLHQIGIAHRDLKLENCLLTDQGIVKIIDFGCATVFKTPFQKEPSKVVGICGSDPYIAPEVLMSRRQLPYFAQVADVWSVGIMFMCMTLLKFPWRVADTEIDRNYGSYIREWPRGREKLFTQLPKLCHGGKEAIEGMVYPDVKGRLTMDQVMSSEWMKGISVCHINHPSKTHTHHMKTEHT
ncbi:serine/threonine protein kinase [Coemansia sp. RSA 1365]|nr:serine/threonine protein kinase [Coemansia sp. RSA 1365]